MKINLNHTIFISKIIAIINIFKFIIFIFQLLVRYNSGFMELFIVNTILSINELSITNMILFFVFNMISLIIELLISNMISFIHEFHIELSIPNITLSSYLFLI